MIYNYNFSESFYRPENEKFGVSGKSIFFRIAINLHSFLKDEKKIYFRQKNLFYLMINSIEKKLIYLIYAFSKNRLSETKPDPSKECEPCIHPSKVQQIFCRGSSENKPLLESNHES